MIENHVMRSLFLPLLCVSASIVYSRPGETETQIHQRYGAPLTEDGTVSRSVSAKPFTPSLRETSRIFHFGDLEITVYFYDNRSQREEFRKPTDAVSYFSPRHDLVKTERFKPEGGWDARIKKAEADQIINGVSNRAPSTVVVDEKDPAIAEKKKKFILEKGIEYFNRDSYGSTEMTETVLALAAAAGFQDFGGAYYKFNGFRAWMDDRKPDGPDYMGKGATIGEMQLYIQERILHLQSSSWTPEVRVIVETDAFRAYRLQANPAKEKPEVLAGKGF